MLYGKVTNLLHTNLIYHIAGKFGRENITFWVWQITDDSPNFLYPPNIPAIQ